MQGVDEIEVRPFSSRQEYELMLDYFYKADDPFLRGMGVDRLKLPERNKWLDALLADHEKPDGERDRFYLLWIFRGTRVGHSSINKIVLGDEAFIHLHLWNSQLRRAGLGDGICAEVCRLFTSSASICKNSSANPGQRILLPIDC
jgi:hypothetical protein